MLPAPLTLLSLLAAPAHADERGLVVRLALPDGPAPGSALVVLTAPNGDVKRIPVKDDGAPPDLTAKDATYAGALWLEGDSFDVSLELEGKTIPGGPAAWDPATMERDLVVEYAKGSVTVEAGASRAASSPPPDGGGGDPNATDAAGSGSAGAAPSYSTAAAPAGAAPSGPGFQNGDAGSASLLYVAFGVGTLLLVGVAWMWLRARTPAAPTPDRSLALVPEPPLFGQGTPSLSDGLQLWIVPDADAPSLLRPLLATLARHHAVLVAAPAAVTVPGVFGGPVYRSAKLRPSHVGDAAESLQRAGTVVTVLLFGTQSDAASVKDYADLLPDGIGGICLLGADPGVAALPRVTARRDGAHWVVQTEEGVLRLAETATGLEPVV
jgi:hypothetical protein